MKAKFLTATAATALLAGAITTATGAVAQNIVTMNTVQIFGSIDPAKISDYTDYMAAVNLYDGLITVAPDGSLIPRLAESWTVSDDATEVVFTLRADATFADGSPVEAKDVVYTFERLLRLNQGPSNLFAGIVAPGAVEAIDDKTVKFSLSQTFSPFMATVPALMIVNADLVEANAGDDDAQSYLAQNVAGAGAYDLVTWDRGARMVIRRNADYYGGFPENAIDEVRWVVTNDEATVRAMAASGELTMTSQYQSTETYDALAAMGRFRVESFATPTAFYMKLNNQTAPTNDVHIRRAIAYATDFDTIREVLFPGEPMNTVLPGSFSAFLNTDVVAPTYDLEKAAAEIALSAYAGQQIPITLSYVAGTQFEEDISLLMQANLESLGFVVTQQPEPWNRVTELAATTQGTPNLNQIFYGPTYPSPDSMFFPQYHSNGAGTWISMDWAASPEVDALIDAARATGDTEAQAALYRDVQQILADQQVTIPLLSQLQMHAIDQCLQGMEMVPMMSFEFDFRKFHWDC